MCNLGILSRVLLAYKIQVKDRNQSSKEDLNSKENHQRPKAKPENSRKIVK